MEREECGGGKWWREEGINGQPLLTIIHFYFFIPCLWQNDMYRVIKTRWMVQKGFRREVVFVFLVIFNFYGIL